MNYNTIWHTMDEKRITPNDFMAVIEIEKGSNIKYELDKETGLIKVDRILYTSTHYPANYGFIPKTYADDNDPLDVLVFCSEKIMPLSLIQVYPIGVMTMIDDGSMDEKIIAVPFNDPTYNTCSDLNDLPVHVFEEMKHFFSVYKTLENKETAVDEVLGADKAREIIAKSIEHYKESFPDVK